MRKRITTITAVCLSMVLVLAACGNNNDGHSSSMPPELVALDVSVQIHPEPIEPGVPVTIAATVTLEGESVEDASEVEFEVWKKGQEEHEMILFTDQDKNTYSITKTFDEEGIYYVVSHVTARNGHRMPKTEFIVGNPPVDTGTDAESLDAADSHNEGEHHAEHGEE